MICPTCKGNGDVTLEPCDRTRCACGKCGVSRREVRPCPGCGGAGEVAE